MTESENVEEAVRILEDGTDEERKAILEALSEQSNTQPAALLPHLDIIGSFADSKDVDVRHNVALILSNAARHEPSAVMAHIDTVRTLLADDDPFVLSAATETAESLARESSTALSAAADRLIELLTYESDWTSHSMNETRARAAATLGNLGEHDPAIAARSDDPLATLLDHPDSGVRADTIVAITQLGLAHPESVPTALAQLPKRLDDDHAGVRRNAIITYVHFRRNQPAAISQPDVVAPALRQAAERTDLDNTEEEGVAETCEYIEEMPMSDD